MIERCDLVRTDKKTSHFEEADFGERTDVGFLHNPLRIRALHLKAKQLSIGNIGRRSVKFHDPRVVLSLLQMEAHPIWHVWFTDQAHFVLFLAGQDRIADIEAVAVADDVLLRLHRTERRETVDAEIRKQPIYVTPLDKHAAHMKR